MAGCARYGPAKEALNLFQRMQLDGATPDSGGFVNVLKACACIGSLEQGKQIHDGILKSGIKPNKFLGSTLVDMYAKFGSLDDASHVFHQMYERDVVSWNVMIKGYANSGFDHEALKYFRQMQIEGIEPNVVTIQSILKACVNPEAFIHGKQIHVHITGSGFESNVSSVSTLINMYAKCGSIETARSVFDTFSNHNVVSWNVMIARYAQIGLDKESFKLFEDMQRAGVKPDHVTFTSILQVCADVAGLEQGKKIHAHVIESGFEVDIFLGSTLVDMYVKCGSIELARSVFDQMCTRDLYTWNVMIAGYSMYGPAEVLNLFQEMLREAVKPSEVTFVSIIKACSCLGSLGQGMQIHVCILEFGYNSNNYICSSLIDMYAKCGSIQDAHQVFNKMQKRDAASWNVIIAGYTNHGQMKEALKLFWKMQQEGENPEETTFVSILKACDNADALKQGQQIHAHIIQSGIEMNLSVWNTLISMYVKCGSIETAFHLFKQMPTCNVVSWNVMSAALTKHGQFKEVLHMFWSMQQKGLKPDEVTFLSVLRACTSLGLLENGKQMHAHIIISGFESDLSVSNNLIDMYAKCGSLENACRVFETVDILDVVSWTVMISGFVLNGNNEQAFDLFCKMQQESMHVDEITFVSVLKACASLAILEQGKRIHAYIVQSGYEEDTSMGSAVIDMYAKCGSIEDALQLFTKMTKQDVVSWTAMVSAYAQHGHANQVLRLTEQMQQMGLRFDDVTFLNIFSACSHAGLVEEGQFVFASMIQDYGIIPTVEHYACMVDLLGRVGQLEDAYNFIKGMPFQPGTVVWKALLGACRIHNHVELANRISGCVLNPELESTGAFVTLSNIYAAAGSRDCYAQVDMT